MRANTGCQVGNATRRYRLRGWPAKVQRDQVRFHKGPTSRSRARCRRVLMWWSSCRWRAHLRPRLRPSWAMSRSVRSRADSRCNKASSASTRSRFSVSTKTGGSSVWLDRKIRTSAASARAGVVDAGVAGQAKEPGLEQARLEQPRQTAQHFDEERPGTNRPPGAACRAWRRRSPPVAPDMPRSSRFCADMLPACACRTRSVSAVESAFSMLRALHSNEGRTVSEQESCVFCTVRHPTVSGEKNLRQRGKITMAYHLRLPVDLDPATPAARFRRKSSAAAPVQSNASPFPS